ncbi:glycosyltransferase [Aquisalinus flavus]|uniref:glycosyltransferase n=1 Tax=Aquisalinus flavus TaxID=1526572 RepID=UPI00165F6F33|nr:glycosyltransferase [Aquisalinus flavus]MBD0426217.1 glycosyltransferase [Aquisalinus flavus]
MSRSTAAGTIDTVDEAGIQGWAFASDSDFRQAVYLVIDRAVRLPVTIDIVREDVVAAGAAPEPLTGFHLTSSFLSQLSADDGGAFFDGGSHHLALEVSGSEVFAMETGLTLLVPTDPGISGSIDCADAFGVEGWVFDEAGRHETQTRISFDRQVSVPVTAFHPRPDVQEARGLPGDKVGFSVSFDSLSQDDRARLEPLVQGGDLAIALSVAGKPVQFQRAGFAGYSTLQVSEAASGIIEGWLAVENMPDRELFVDILTNGHLLGSIAMTRVDLARAQAEGRAWGCAFSLRLACSPTGQARDTLRFRLHGTIGQKEPELTLALPPRRDPAPGLMLAGARLPLPGRVTIVIPVHNAARQFEACLESIFRHTTHPARLVIVDDASTDPAIGEILARYQSHPLVEIVRHAENRGYTAAINSGIAVHQRGDIVLLNSDTRVTPRWLENMVLASRSGPRIGTVTALSDNAGVFSVKPGGGGLPAGIDEAALARAVTRSGGFVYPETPTGNGFCLYLARECLDETGPFDAGSFPRGYGEENDFCMRAIAHGWRHIIDDRTLVFHDHAASFGDEKQPLLDRARTILDQRYPDYAARVAAFVKGQEMHLVRARLGAALEALGRRPDKAPLVRVMYVISVSEGGTALTNQDLMAQMQGRIETLLAECDGRLMTLSRIAGDERDVLETYHLSTPVDPASHRSAEYDRVMAGWLAIYGVELIHVRHIAFHSLGLTDIAKSLSVPVIFSFHDFYAVCPTVKLLDETLTYCGGTCTTTAGECAVDLWTGHPLPPLKDRWVHDWRRNFARVLRSCDRFVTTSQTARDVIARNFPALPAEHLRVIRHGRDIADMAPPRKTPPDTDRSLRVLVPGHLSPAKGSHLISEIKALDREGRIEFHLMGNAAAVPEMDGIVHHGPYDRAGFADQVRAIDPDIGAVLSIWPETYSHTLTELWAAGLPVLAIDIGAVGERLSETGAGWPVPAEAEALASVLFDQLMAIASEPGCWNGMADRVAAAQAGLMARPVADMAADYRALYEDVLQGVFTR